MSFWGLLPSLHAPDGPSKLFHWPKNEDNCWISESDILCVIDTPSLASSQRMYCLSKQDEVRISRLWGKWISDQVIALFP